MKHPKLQRSIQVAFLLGIALLLFSSLAKTYFFPKEINSYENRKANQPPAVSLTGFLSGQFQDNLENALTDQVFGAQSLERGYNTIESSLSLSALSKLYDAYPNRYFRYDRILVFNSDYLLYAPRTLTEDSRASFDRKLHSIQATAEAHPQLDFHVFYIEKDTDMNFETGEDCGNYSYIAANRDPKLYGLSCFSTDSFQAFSENFYQTDHHWNHKGSYKAYLQLCEDMGLSDPVEPGEEFLVASHLSGSKLPLVNHAKVFSEPMYAYRFDFPSMSITINGQPAEDYGQQNSSSAGAPMTYGQYYGSDMGEVLFSTGDTSKENILIVGESYDNAVLKLLATHFNETCSIDLRYYEHYMGKAFDFSTYVQEHEIDRVLLIGNIDYFVMDEFNIGE